VFLAGAPEALAELGVVEDLETALGGLLGRVDQEARYSALDLERDAAHVPGDGRPSLPERLGHGKPEALAGRLLKHDVRLRLEGIDLDRPDVVEIVEDLDVGVVCCVLVRLLEVVPAFGVVRREGADEGKLKPIALLLRTSITPSGSFQGSKRETWQISGRSTSTPN
jgi:hypothetical protein